MRVDSLSPKTWLLAGVAGISRAAPTTAMDRVRADAIFIPVAPGLQGGVKAHCLKSASPNKT